MVNGSICLSTENLWSDTNSEKPKQVPAEQIATVLCFLELLQQGLSHSSKQVVAGEVERNVLHLIKCEKTTSSVVQCCIKKLNNVREVYTQILIPIPYNVYTAP